VALLIVGVSGQQPKKPGKPFIPPPAPLLPAEQAWLVTLTALPSAAGTLDEHRIYIPLEQGGTLALDRETGQPQWTTTVETTWPVVVAGDHAILVRPDEVIALDADTGELRWQTPLQSNPIAPAIRAGDLVVTVLENEDVVALRVADGTLAWAVKVPGVVAPLALAADRDAVYFNAGPSTITAVALADGAVKWRQQLAGQLSAPAVAKDLVLVGSTANGFYALGAATGQQKWNWGSHMIGGDVIGAAVDGDQVFFVGLDNLLHRVNRRNGNQRWEKATPTRPVAPPVVFGGIVVVFGVSPTMAAFNADTGAAMGTYVAPAASGATSAPILKGPPLVDPVLRPFRVAAAVITADGRAIGLRPTAMMFREQPSAPLPALPGKPLTRESAPSLRPAR
jgi:outer membrane protein assembly factor BamB